MNRKRFYLSGPMTGLPHLNYPAFAAASAALRSLGHEVYSPNEWEDKYNKGIFNHSIAFADYCTYISREADAIVVLPNWRNSPGARAEVALAFAIRKPVFEYDPLEPSDEMKEIDDGPHVWCSHDA